MLYIRSLVFKWCSSNKAYQTKSTIVYVKRLFIDRVDSMVGLFVSHGSCKQSLRSHYSSSWAWTSSVSATNVAAASAAEATTLATFSATFSLAVSAASLTASDADSALSLTISTIFSGSGTPSMPSSSVSKTKSCQLYVGPVIRMGAHRVSTRRGWGPCCADRSPAQEGW